MTDRILVIGATGQIGTELVFNLREIYGNDNVIAADIKDLEKSRPKLIVCGDYNICHKAIDIHNPVSNKNSSGFLPEERAWMEKFFNSGFIYFKSTSNNTGQ